MGAPAGAGGRFGPGASGWTARALPGRDLLGGMGKVSPSAGRARGRPARLPASARGAMRGLPLPPVGVGCDGSAGPPRRHHAWRHAPGWVAGSIGQGTGMAHPRHMTQTVRATHRALLPHQPLSRHTSAQRGAAAPAPGDHPHAPGVRHPLAPLCPIPAPLPVAPPVPPRPAGRRPSRRPAGGLVAGRALPGDGAPVDLALQHCSAPRPKGLAAGGPAVCRAPHDVPRRGRGCRPCGWSSKRPLTRPRPTRRLPPVWVAP
jgi:hypothetical protein